MDKIRRIAASIAKYALTLWKFFAGGIIVAIGFYANFVDLKQPDIAIEITEIQQKTSSDVDIKSSPQFARFRELTNDDLDFRLSSGLATNFSNFDIFKEIQTAIDRQSQQIVDVERSLDKLRNEAEKIPKDFKPTLTDDEKNRRMQVEALWGDTTTLKMGDGFLSNLSYDEAKKKLELFQRKINSKRDLIKLAQNEFEAFKVQSEKKDAKIIVTAAITNSGDGSTTLKPQALLRTDLGQGNYLDINLRISNFDSSEVKPRGASVVKFESPAISYMAPQDQERFLSFFKNTSPTNLYIGDVRGQYYKSNTIPFAQGIYEQKIYDGLKRYASETRR